MDDFDVRAQSTTILSSSSLVDDLVSQVARHKSFPVIIDGFARTFHDIRGGYDDQSDQHIVKLVQHRDHLAEPLTDVQAGVYEVHLDDSFLLYAEDFYRFDDEAETVLCIGISRYEQQEFSMKEQMEQPLVSREPDSGYSWIQ